MSVDEPGTEGTMPGLSRRAVLRDATKLATVAVIVICFLLPRQSIKQRLQSGDTTIDQVIPKRVAVPFD